MIMEHVFLRILETGLAAGGIILLVLLLCFALRKAPKMVSYVLWTMVFVRLAFPVEFASPVGLMPSVRISSDGVMVEGFGKNSRIGFPWNEDTSVDRQENVVPGEENGTAGGKIEASGTDGGDEGTGVLGTNVDSEEAGMP